MTDKGLLAILDCCHKLQSLTLTEVEGKSIRDVEANTPIAQQAFQIRSN